MVDQKLLPGNC